MSKWLRITLIVTLVAAMLAAGFPLSLAGGKPGFASSHPLQSARCFKIGDTTGLFSCLATAGARLDGVTLISTIRDRLDLVAYPFGYLFIAFLALFLIFALILI